MQRTTYKDAIEWIAENDVNDGEPDSWLSLVEISESPLVAFCAMLYGLTEDEVSVDVLQVRTRARSKQMREARKAFVAKEAADGQAQG